MRIEDEVLKPYFIESNSGGGYALMRRVKVGENHPITGKPNKHAGEVQEETLGYYPNIPIMLEIIARGLAHMKLKDQSMTVRQYIDELKAIYDSVKNVAEI